MHLLHNAYLNTYNLMNSSFTCSLTVQPYQSLYIYQLFDSIEHLHVFTCTPHHHDTHNLSIKKIMSNICLLPSLWFKLIKKLGNIRNKINANRTSLEARLRYLLFKQLKNISPKWHWEFFQYYSFLIQLHNINPEQNIIFYVELTKF